MINLSKVYLVVLDNKFVTYIKSEKDYYDDGLGIIPDRLMNVAPTRYKVLTNTNK